MTTELRIGDCRTVMPEFPGVGSMDLVLTDPPYRILANGFDRTWRGRRSKTFGRGKHSYGTDAPDYYEWLGAARATLKPTGAIVCFETKDNLENLSLAMTAAEFRVVAWGVWVVWGRATYSGVKPISKFDIWVLGGRERFKMKRSHGLQDAYGGARDEQSKFTTPRGHPTVAGMKPVGMLRRMIRHLTPLGGSVLDPFAGSGSTLRAARELDRSGYGIEVRPELEAYIRSTALADVHPLEESCA
jgi:DNA modification methylase